MKKMILLTLLSFVFFAFQAKAQDNVPVKGGTYKSYKAPVVSKTTAKQVEKQTPTTGNVKPNSTNTTVSDYPKYINTGNITKDEENHRIAKDAWIAKNPTKYEEMIKNNQSPNK